jgi:lipopolysaccharide biosynthesis regulator YciM
VTDTAVLAVVLAAVAGVVAGRAWSAAHRRGELRDRPGFRSSSHYLEGLHYLGAGQVDKAIVELSAVAREAPEAVEVLQVLGDLLRESGQMEKALQLRRQVLDRRDLTRSERAHALAALGTDYRRSGFLDRAAHTFEEVLALEPANVQALVGIQTLQEEQRQWKDAYETRARLAQLRQTDDRVVLAHLQAAMGQDALAAGQPEAAEGAFRAAIALDPRVLPAHLGLADLLTPSEPRRAAAILEAAVRADPDRGYLAFDRLAALYAACGQPSRFVELCEELIGRDPRDWRARLALARALDAEGRHDEALGLLQRAIEVNPHALELHLAVWRVLQAAGAPAAAVDSYLRSARDALFYRDPHLCTSCRYRADAMLWRCPQCHEWNTFVEERLAQAAGAR